MSNGLLKIRLGYSIKSRFLMLIRLLLVCFALILYRIGFIGAIIPFPFYGVYIGYTIAIRLWTAVLFLRFHPLDWFLDNCSILVACFIFGLDLNIVVFNFILYLPLFIAHHSLFVFPEWFDRTIGKIIVSPNFHKVHHHQNQVYTDSNHGNIFIFWDKLFGTYKTLPVSEIKYGLAEFDTTERQSFWFLLKSPFLKVKRLENE